MPIDQIRRRGASGPLSAGVTTGAHAVRTTTQSIADITTTWISMPTLIRDDGGFWNSGSDSRLTAVQQRIHLHVSGAQWATNATQSRICEPTINRTVFINLHRVRSTAGTPTPYQGAGTVWFMSIGDYYETSVWQNSGGSLNVDSAEHAIATNTAWLGAAVRRDTAQTIGNNSETALSFSAEDHDGEGYWVIGSPTRLTIPTTGWYIVYGTAAYDSNITGHRRLRILINNTTEHLLNQMGANVTGGGNVYLGGARALYLTAGDFVELFTHQTSGGNLNVFAFGARAGIIRTVSAQGVDVQRTSNQAISLNTETTITFEQENRDDNGFWAGGSPTRITAPNTGWYFLSAAVRWDTGAATGDRRAKWRLNGTTDRFGNNFTAVGAANATNIANALVYMTAAEYAELRVFQSGENPLNVNNVRATCLYLG